MSLIEILVVIVMIGLMTAVVMPRFRVSPRTRVRQAADQLVRDLELARGRALSTRSWTRVVFDPANEKYVGFQDFNRDSIFALTTEETDSLGGFRARGLTNPFGTKGVIYLITTDDPTAIAAVTVSGAAGIRTWLYDGTTWR
jgi:Tfp pilus assembly protein FimT